jgi:lipopolysaccharide/colanic/teichoic acid biosynthesis glycosyltransferase
MTPSDALTYPSLPLRERLVIRLEWFSYATLKRGFDVAVSLLLLVATAPLWLLIAIAIKLESPGPVFFVQERVGYRGRHFQCFKFRSMQVDAEARLEAMRKSGEVKGMFVKARRDPRITRVGRLLRRTSLDELPQLVNVLKGEMSLVGPRPLPLWHAAQLRPEHLVRQNAKPGLTCLWVIRGRSDCKGGFEGWMAADEEYVKRRSIWLDMVILTRTASIVLSGQGAY